MKSRQSTEKKPQSLEKSSGGAPTSFACSFSSARPPFRGLGRPPHWNRPSLGDSSKSRLNTKRKNSSSPRHSHPFKPAHPMRRTTIEDNRSSTCTSSSLRPSFLSHLSSPCAQPPPSSSYPAVVSDKIQAYKDTEEDHGRENSPVRTAGTASASPAIATETSSGDDSPIRPQRKRRRPDSSQWTLRYQHVHNQVQQDNLRLFVSQNQKNSRTALGLQSNHQSCMHARIFVTTCSDTADTTCSGSLFFHQGYIDSVEQGNLQTKSGAVHTANHMYPMRALFAFQLETVLQLKLNKMDNGSVIHLRIYNTAIVPSSSLPVVLDTRLSERLATACDAKVRLNPQHTNALRQSPAL